MSSHCVLVVDHDSKSIHLLRQIMSSAGYEVLSTNKIDRALQMAAEEQPLLIISEFDLQTESDGLTLIRRLREFSETPLIILSERAETAAVLFAFEAGADDFIAKPYDPKILLARVKAILKRCSNIPITTNMLTVANISINLSSHQVMVDDHIVALTQTEYRLLVELARHAGQVLSHKQLLVSVWGPQYTQEIDYLRSYIHTLRRKLGSAPSQNSLIVSLSGVGYMLDTHNAEISGN